MIDRVRFEKEINGILEAARELAVMVRKHPIVLEYEEQVVLLKESPEAVELVEQLITMGRNLNMAIRNGGEIDPDSIPEMENINRELETMPFVKDYISSKKAYVTLISEIIRRIRNPE